MIRIQCALLVVPLLLSFTHLAVAEVERYKDESEYAARLDELGYVVLQEDFEGTAFDHVRSSNLTQHVALSITTRQVTWSSASHELWNYVPTTYITNNPNWARGPGWYIWSHLARLARQSKLFRMNGVVAVQ